MAKVKEVVLCKRTDCRGNIRGRCTVLREEFKDKECPFYKTRKDFDKQEAYFINKKMEEN